jgi:hypothetical protein
VTKVSGGGFRQSRESQKEHYAAKVESTPTEARHGSPDGHGGPSVAEAMDGGKRPLIEVGVS